MDSIYENLMNNDLCFCPCLQPVLLGTAALLLRSVLESEDLGHIVSLPVQSTEGPAAKQGVGPLKVTARSQTNYPPIIDFVSL